MPRKAKLPEDFLYTLQTGAESYIITKYDSIGLEQLSQYVMPIIDDEVSCTCPQGLKPTCRHRKMLPAMLPRIDTHYFYRYGDETWWKIERGELSISMGGPEVADQIDFSEPAIIEADASGAPIDTEAQPDEGLTIATYEEVEPEQVAEKFAELVSKPEPEFKRRF